MVQRTGARRYRSKLREDQARATRRRIVDAGRELFIERGYTRTTIDAIAERAEVSRKTVFTSVGGKAELLKLAWDWALAGDDEPVALADRPELQQMMQEPDPDTLIADWSRFQAAIAGRLALLFEALTVAADGDADVAALHAVSEQNRMGGARAFVTRLEEIGGLRAELDLDRASAIAAVLMDPMPYRRLVLDAGWTLDEYADLVDLMARAALTGRPAG
jgi:AcrR family transcriptional regulator